MLTLVHKWLLGGVRRAGEQILDANARLVMPPRALEPSRPHPRQGPTPAESARGRGDPWW
jgi:hypothetical protein